MGDETVLGDEPTREELQVEVAVSRPVDAQRDARDQQGQGDDQELRAAGDGGAANTRESRIISKPEAAGSVSAGALDSGEHLVGLAAEGSERR